jgi:Tfp pilus assembly protein PilX
MNPARAASTRVAGAQDGMVLAAVLVLMVVMMISGFAAAVLTRTDVQLVNNAASERQAFYTAEAGVAEALLRLNMQSPTNVTVDGQTFDASLTGPNAPDATQPTWQAQILFSGAGPVKAGNTVTAPTVQLAASRLPYSTASSGSDALTIAWELAGGAIRQIGGRNVLTITSTGQSGTARRKIVERVVLSNTAAIALDAAVCPGFDTSGNGAVTLPGSVAVNSSCGTAMSASKKSPISASGPITLAGSGYSGSVSPTPSRGAAATADPLSSLPAPSFSGRPVRNGSAASPSLYQPSGTTTIQPGIYYGGVKVKNGADMTMAPGVYIMAGGGLQVTNTGQLTANGVMIYSTCAVPPVSGACTLTGSAGYGTIDFNSKKTISLTAQTSSGPEPIYEGIALFQDRMSSQDVSINAKADGLIDGLVYAPAATFSMSGSGDLVHSQLVVGAVSVSGGPLLGPPSSWLSIGGGGVQVLGWQDF